MKKFLLFSFLFPCLLLLLIFPVPIESATFSQSYIRLDRQKPQTPTSGLVCAEPATAGIENSVTVTFPSSFTVSTTTSNWTVATTNIPSGATAWPGISTATAVSGKTVTFPSADLATDTLYCFQWNKTQALSTGSEGQQTGANITTKTLGGVTIDSTNLTLPVSDDQLSVTATVDPLASVAEMEIEGSPTSGSTLAQNKEVTVTISYRHNAAGSFPMEINGTWEQGLIEGTSSNYIDIFDYVVGSATPSDDGSVPVVDLVNRRITWNISALSSSTSYHTVSFKLKTKDDIPTDNRISASIKAGGMLSGTTLSEKSISYMIKKVSQATTSTPTPTPSPSKLPVPTPTGRPTTVASQPFRFDFVRINEIADTYLAASFQTNKPSTYTLFYGNSPSNLNKNITGLTPQTLHNVKLPDLLPKTQYYFKITARDQAGNAVTSDLFTATTASDKDTIQLAREDFTIHWKNYFLISQSINTVVIPRNKAVTITTRITDSANISKIKALFVNEKVLGINTLAPRANIGETPLIEILPGVFSGEIESPGQNGIYSIIFEITDVKGGLYKKAAPYKFYVTDPLRVIDKNSKKPIENAEVKITKYQESLKLFAPLQNSFALVSRTNANGELDIVLPTGKYDIEVKAHQHKSQIGKAELGISATAYPVFELERLPILQSLTSYYQDSVKDLYGFTTLTAETFFSSQRAKDLYLIFIFLFLLLLIMLDTHVKKRVGLTRTLITFSILDVFVVLSGITTLLFIKYLGVSDAAFLIAITIFIFILGIVYVRKAFFKKN